MKYFQILNNKVVSKDEFIKPFAFVHNEKAFKGIVHDIIQYDNKEYYMVYVWDANNKYDPQNKILFPAIKNDVDENTPYSFIKDNELSTKIVEAYKTNFEPTFYTRRNDEMKEYDKICKRVLSKQEKINIGFSIFLLSLIGLVSLILAIVNNKDEWTFALIYSSLSLAIFSWCIIYPLIFVYKIRKKELVYIYQDEVNFESWEIINNTPVRVKLIFSCFLNNQRINLQYLTNARPSYIISNLNSLKHNFATTHTIKGKRPRAVLVHLIVDEKKKQKNEVTNEQ